MEIDEYFESLLSEVRQVAIADGSTKKSAFLKCAMDRIVDFGDVDNYESIAIDQNFDENWQADAWHYDENFHSLWIVINLFDGSTRLDEMANLTTTELQTEFKRAKSFLQKCLQENPADFSTRGQDLFSFAGEIKNKWPLTKEIKFLFVTNRPLSGRFDNRPLGDINQRKASLSIWDINRFKSVELAETEREEIEIDFSDGPISVLEASKAENLISYLAVMPAKKLAEIYGTWKSRVLEQNVRSFLQNRTNVNKGIRLTIEQNPERFFAYNNGITITAENIEFDHDNRLIKVRNLQIVNGGQTTAQIYHAYRAGRDLSAVTVQMKLNLVTQPDFVNELIPYIARFANKQNPVSEADLFSNSPYHRKMEEFSRRVIPPVVEGNIFPEHWFYERSRGQYLNEQADMTPAQKRDFQKTNPKPKLITKTDIALVINAFDQVPWECCKGAQANFKYFAGKVDYEKNKTKYNKYYFQETIVKTIIQRQLRKEVQAQEWYSGFLANIVWYTVAWLSNCMERKKVGLDTNSLWKTQLPPDELIDACIPVAKNVYDHLADHQGNPTTYSKGKTCWANMQRALNEIPLDLRSGILLDIDEIERLRSDAEDEEGGMTAAEWEIYLSQIDNKTWAEIRGHIGNNMTPNLDRFIAALENNQMLQDYQASVLVPHVKDYKDGGGEITGPPDPN